MELRYYLRIFQRSWWLILVTSLVAVILSLVYSFYIATPMYEAVARFIISPNMQFIQGSSIVSSLDTLDKRSIISTYAEVLNSPQIISGTYELLGENPADFINYTTSVTVLPDANILRLSVKGPNPEVAAMLANSIGQHAIDYVRVIYVVYNIDFLDKALPPATPYQPVPLQDAALALLIGIVIGLGLAIFREQLTVTLNQYSERKTIDPESLAYTRNYFERLAREEFANHPNSVVTISFIYLNGIEDYLESLPQAYINQIMSRVTKALKYQLRGNDIVGRWSQLRFCVLLPSTDAESASRRMPRIKEMLEQRFSLDVDQDISIELDPRIGLADSQAGESLQVLIDQAEQALEISMQSETKINIFSNRKKK
jgi:diguanylate cyclase (GGDEF)-like protein